MNWLVKVAAFKILSSLPGGSSLYRYCQESVTHSLVPTRPRVQGKVNVGMLYWDWLESHGALANPQEMTHLDFGTGWHPTIPLLLYSLGIGRQYLFDVVPVMDERMIEQTVPVFREIATDPQWPHRNRLKRLPETTTDTAQSAAARLEKMGMTYVAPYFGRFSEVAGRIDVATCTQVLLHIPRETLLTCFRELHGALKPGGRFLGTIHLMDLYSHLGGGVSKYNHLKFSPSVWEKFINSPLMSFNRLKAPDYRELLEKAGFKIVHFEVDSPTPDDLRELAQIPVHNCFRRYTKEELGAKHLFFAAEKS